MSLIFQGGYIKGMNKIKHKDKGLRIKKTLRNAGITQKDFANYCGLSLKVINKYLNSGELPVYVMKLAKQMIEYRGDL